MTTPPPANTPDAETVPEWLRPHIEAVREAVGLSDMAAPRQHLMVNVSRHWLEPLVDAARALADAVSESNRRNADNRHAVERPTAGEDEPSVSAPGPLEQRERQWWREHPAPTDPVSEEPCNYGAHFAGCKHEIPKSAPTDPVMLTMWAAGWCANPDCKCLAFTPAPPPSTPREDKDWEAEAHGWAEEANALRAENDELRVALTELAPATPREELADAWDEGHAARCLHGQMNQHGGCADNPYRGGRKR